MGVSFQLLVQGLNILSIYCISYLISIWRLHRQLYRQIFSRFGYSVSHIYMIHMHACIQTYRHTHMHTCTHTHPSIHPSIHPSVRTYVRTYCAHVYTHTDRYVHTWNAKVSRKNWQPEIIKRLRWYSRDWRGTAKFSGHFGFPKGSNKFGPFPAPCTSHWKDVMVYEASMQKVFSIVAIGFFKCFESPTVWKAWICFWGWIIYMAWSHGFINSWIFPNQPIMGRVLKLPRRTAHGHSGALETRVQVEDSKWEKSVGAWLGTNGALS